jgi:hypothetical protein
MKIRILIDPCYYQPWGIFQGYWKRCGYLGFDLYRWGMLEIHLIYFSIRFRGTGTPEQPHGYNYIVRELHLHERVKK